MSRYKHLLTQYLNSYSVLFSFILLASVFLRFHELGQPFFWSDEVSGVWSAKNFLEGHGFSNPAGEAYPYHRALITYIVPITASFAALGYNEFAARLPSVIIGVATVLIVYFFGRDIGGRKLGLLASGMMALDFWVVGWHTQARMYVHNQFFYILGVWLVSRWFNRDKLGLKSKYLFLLMPVCILGFHNHKSYLAIAPVIGVFLSITFLSGLKEWSLSGIKQNVLAKRQLSWLVFGAFLSLLFLSEALNILFWVLEYSPGWYTETEGMLYYLRFFNQQQAITTLFGFGFILSLREKENWVLPIAFAIPFLFQSMVYYKVPRLVFHLYPLFLMMFAVPLVYLLNILESTLKSYNISSSKIGWISAFCIVLTLSSMYNPVQNLESKETKPHIVVGNNNHREAVDYISAHQKNGEVLISTEPSITGWYLGDINEVDYSLLNYEAENVSGELMDPKVGVPIIKDRSEIRGIINNETGWIIADANFYDDNVKIEEGVRKEVVQNSDKISKGNWTGVEIYRFN